jgi:hypothetical protein
MTRWPDHPLLYEINAWSWLRELSDAAGQHITLADVPQSELERFAALGFDCVWLMGVWKRSPRAREIAASIPHLLSDYQRVLPDFTAADVVGSPYAIHRYEVDAEQGGAEALAVLRERLRERGLRLILDFVPNHLAIDHPWVAEHPRWFVQTGSDRLTAEPENYFTREIDGTIRIFAHGRDPHYKGWTDTVQLDHRTGDTRRAMCELLAGIADQCDGVRCDMAMLVVSGVFARTWGGEFDSPDAEFWTEAIGVVKTRNPAFLLIAEVYWDLEYRLQQLGFDYTYDKRLYDRLVNGNAESLRAHLGRRPAKRSDLLMQAHYERLLRALSDPPFHEGAWQLLDPQPAGAGESYRAFVAHQWSSPNARRLVAVNWSANQAQCFVPLDVPALPRSWWLLRDLLSGAEYRRHGNDLLNPGLYLDIPAYSYHVFDVRRL